MGYNVSIVRTAQGRASPFSQAELESLCLSHPQWTYDSRAETLSKESGDEQGFWLDVSPEELTAKQPNERQIGLMIELARTLGGRVRGDDLETCRSPADICNHPDDDILRATLTPLPVIVAPRRPKWIAWIRMGLLIILCAKLLVYILH